MTVYLVFMGFNYASSFRESFPDHLLTTIYCFGIIPVFIFGLFKNKAPRIVTLVIALIGFVVMLIIGSIAKPFEAYINYFIEENEIVFIGEPYVSHSSSLKT